MISFKNTKQIIYGKRRNVKTTQNIDNHIMKELKVDITYFKDMGFLN